VAGRRSDLNRASRPADGLTVISFGKADRAALDAAYLGPFTQATGIGVRSLTYDGQVTELTQMVHCRRAGVGCDAGRIANPGARLPAGPVRKVRSGAHSGRRGSHSRGAVGVRRGDFYLGASAGVFRSACAMRPSPGGLSDIRKFTGKRDCGTAPNIPWRSPCWPTAVDPKDVYATLSTDAGVARAFRKLDQIKRTPSGGRPPLSLGFSWPPAK